jgi:hypothetical protein
MATPPPVPANQRYPIQLRDFCTYQDQPGDGSHILTTIDPVTDLPVITDLTIDKAAVTNDMHMEIISIERTIGTRPFTPPQCTTVGQAIGWLYNNTADLVHMHLHVNTQALAADDHHEYALRDGDRAFQRPITSPPAKGGNQLVNYSQVTGAGYLTTAQLESLLTAHLTSQGPEATSPYGRLKIIGGVAQGYTNANGNLYVPFGAGFRTAVISFVYMKMPFPGLSMLGWYNYQYMEDQLTLLSLDNNGAWIQFIEDIQVDRQATVCMCWQAIGV